MVDIFAEIARLSTDARMGSFDIDLHNPAHHEAFLLPRENTRKQLLQFVKENGYIPMQTVREFKDKLFKYEHLRKATDDEVQEITDAAEKLGNSDWSRNAKAA